ncbi:hypothetical protein ACNJ8R_004139 [Cronobacter sakazakii]|uniref:hypothetical protein n=1 Tax=Cronobacter sakazakii TaxID=28141 RepID=UPI0009BC545E|nr:hypothetical protein [Cronobacter sakazakii]EKY3179883.1 hypothetical protein [Cronobacter turicensis]ELY4007653.1 hypothetical protein [Cronobacter dublinensis]EJJ0671544.1 hypothetical protein [Cronobacter sakazakii]EJL7720584.1 hypothetical protein [Cronobacter sakazakii]EJV9557831.1 hypothetical protein [Cronobacter sakazakii]
MDYGFKEGRFFRYPHQPIQIFWFDRDEWLILIASYLASMQLGGLSWLIIFPVSIVAIKIKRTKGRGFFRHTLYNLGLVEIYGYPNSSARKLEE